jgi:hypothetical protein
MDRLPVGRSCIPESVPHFGTPQYWEDETRDLEEQVEYFHSNTEDIPLSIRRDEPEEKEEEHLTNKDYFGTGMTNNQLYGHTVSVRF